MNTFVFIVVFFVPFYDFFADIICIRQDKNVILQQNIVISVYSIVF